MFCKLLFKRNFHRLNYLNVNLKETFNSRPNLQFNNLIKKDVGLFGVPQLTTSDGFHELTEKCIEKSNNLIDEALNVDRKRKMVEIFDDLSDTLCQVADLSEFIRFAHPSSDYNQAAELASIAISGVVEKLNTNLELYKALKQSIDINDIKPLTTIDKLVGNLFLFDFEQSGIHLSEKKRQHIVELNDQILTIGQKFVAEVAKPRIIPKHLLPEIVRHMFNTDGENVIINGLYSDSTNPIIREIAYKIFLIPDIEQEKLLDKLLQLRHELACNCGFDTYAQRALKGSILEQPTNVTAFLDQLSTGLSWRSRLDFDEMLTAKREEHGNSDKLEIWDVPYYTHRAKHEKFRINFAEFSPYFSLGACMEGLNAIFQSLYGISLINTEIGTGETWTPDIYKLAVTHETEGLLGHIYCDFYERRGKPHQDCHFTIRGGKTLSDGTYQLPMVALMLNFSLPRWSSPTLLTTNMVDNLFHEMGHAMHSMLARTVYQHVSGTRCSTDLAEVPSILMEYFASDPRVLRLFARHFQTKQSMSDDMLIRLCASKRVYSASEMELQTFYAMIDQFYHDVYPLDGGSTTDVLAEIQTRYYSLPYVENTAWQLRFSHLVGYGAKYYSYLVSKALAHLIWKKYFENDPLNRTAGELYRNECLGYGGEKNPKCLIGDYLKIVPTPTLLANALIEEVEENQLMIKDLIT